MILSQAQAEAVYSAMCALNNVGNVCGKVAVSASHAKNDIEIRWDADGVKIVRGMLVCNARELYSTQAAFAAAYNLQ